MNSEFNESMPDTSFSMTGEHFVMCVDDDPNFLASFESFLANKINQGNIPFNVAEVEGLAVGAHQFKIG